MPPRPGNLNPDSKAGNARLGRGQGANAGRSQASGANKAVPTPKKLQPPVGSAKPSSLSKYFSQQQAKRNAAGWSDRFPTTSSADHMKWLQKQSSGTRAGRGGMYGIRAGQRKPE